MLDAYGKVVSRHSFFGMSVGCGISTRPSASLCKFKFMPIMGRCCLCMPYDITIHVTPLIRRLYGLSRRVLHTST